MVRTLWGAKFGQMTGDVDAALAGAWAEVLEHLIARMVDPTYTLAQARALLGI